MTYKTRMPWTIKQRWCSVLGALFVANLGWSLVGAVVLCAPALAQQGQDAGAQAAQLAADVDQALKENNLDEAARRLRAAVEKFPLDLNLRRKHISLYGAYLNASRPLDAAEQLGAYIDFLMEQAVANRRTALPELDAYLNRWMALYREANQPDAALEKLAAWQSRLTAAQIDSLPLVRTRALFLSQLDRAEESKQLVAQVLDQAKAAHDRNPQDDQATVKWLEALKLRRDVTRIIDPENAAKADQAFHQALKEAANQADASAPVLAYYVNQELERIQGLALADAKQAEQELGALEQWVKSLPKERVADTTRSLWTRSIAAVKSRLEREFVHEKLVGQMAFPIGQATWLNGTPLTDDDLEGKVVLLDFWAVWCGPCIATFPHLRQWHEKYHEHGLEIVGITQRYKFGWNEQTQRPERVPNITPEQEDEATKKFLEFHKLQHRIAVVDNQSPLYKQYGVTGIPQAVLIDKKGVIRMIRVGSGEQNARDLEKQIEILLKE